MFTQHSLFSIAQEIYHIGKIQSYGNGKKCVLKKTRWGRQETTLVPVLFHYKYFKIYTPFVFQEIHWFEKLKTLEKNEKIRSQKSKPRSNQELTIKNNQKSARFN